jgi:RecJ-like exonuclease
MFGSFEISLPVKMVECSLCYGKGSVLREGLRGECFTSSDIAEDPEFFEDMMDGAFDQTCPDCKGCGKVQAVDEEALTPKQRLLFDAMQEEEEARLAEEAAYYYERRAELGLW